MCRFRLPLKGLSQELLRTPDHRLEINAKKIKTKYRNSLMETAVSGRCSLHLYLAMYITGVFLHADTEGILAYFQIGHILFLNMDVS